MCALCPVPFDLRVGAAVSKEECRLRRDVNRSLGSDLLYMLNHRKIGGECEDAGDGVVAETSVERKAAALGKTACYYKLT
jgi:hypothetical protein